MKTQSRLAFVGPAAVVCLGGALAAAVCLVGTGDGGSRGAEEKAPAPYQVRIERDVRVRMRDGVMLSTDLYVPVRGGRPLKEKLPAVLQRTPYAALEKMASFFARHGYLSVVQDCRGRYASEGTFFPFVNEPKDGYDTIAWLAKHPLCNGKVGMYGCSYLGWVQFQAATQRPPGLVTMIPFEGPVNGYYYSMHTGGAVHLGLLKWSLQMAASSPEGRRHPELANGIQAMAAEQEFLRWASRIPWRRGQTPLANFPRYEDATFQLFFDNPDYSAFWRQPGLGMDEHFASFPDIPSLWVGGWYDWYPRSTCDGYRKMVKLGRKHQHLLIGPWTHNNFESACGEVHFGFGGGSLRSYDDYLELELRWFDRWLKNDHKADVGKRVAVFVMGGGDGKHVDGRINHGGRWLYADTWPPAGSRPTAFYLQGGGVLSREKPGQQHPNTPYTYDPRNTVSSNSRCFIGYGPLAHKGGMGPRDQIELETLPGHGLPGMPIASRPDVVVFQTEPLARDVQVTGDVQMVLYVSSDAPDTDFFVKLIDLYPASGDYPRGFALPVCDGVIRARYRDGFAAPALMKPGQVYRLEIPLEPTANLFKAGHRIRVDVCSSNFPSFDINRNTGDPHGRRWRVAENTVWHDAKHPSSIILPISARSTR
jgi:putative CocE/NonD family hydrolase